MGSKTKQIFVVAGEASGDQHAAHLIAALKEKDPSLSFSGLGGPQMKEQGVDIFYDLTKLAVVGFWEVLKHYSIFRKLFHELLERIEKEKPDAIILVDYPGFNLRLAKALYQKNIKIIYYISPQVWAWKKNRVFAIKKYIDRMLVVFEFEKKFYAEYNMDVDFVGHPLIDMVKPQVNRDKFLSQIGLSSSQTTIGLLPGSRIKEVERHLPVMIEAAKKLKEEFPKLQFVLLKAQTLTHEYYNTHIENTDLPLKLVDGPPYYNALAACDHALVASGTATLETAILGKPMVIMYKTSPFTYMIAKWFVRIPFIGLVNIVAQKEIVPECIQGEATPEKLAHELKSIFIDETKIAAIKTEFIRIREALGSSGASTKAAESVLSLLQEK